MKATRRVFLKAMGILTAAGVAGRKTPLAGAQGMLLNVFSVAGLQYYDGPRMLGALGAGQLLDMRAEPENPYDHYAVELYCGSAKLGYVPRSDNRHISRLLRQGAELRAIVKAVRPDAVSWKAVQVEVRLCA